MWLIEKTGELIFNDNGLKHLAKWAYLKHLYGFESKRVVEFSDLNEISFAPKPIERQWISSCLRVFSEKTYNALLVEIGADKNDTAVFINKLLTW